MQSCPSPDALAALVANGAPDEETHLHLDHCASCRRIVSALAGAEHDALASTLAEVPGADAPAVAPGQVLGRFTISRLLGRGAMGEVWAANDGVLEREVAVKLLRIRPELEVEAAARLTQEAQAMARLRHPNVVAIYDLGSANGQLFCAMELVDGTTLRQWLEGPRPWREVLDVLLGAGRGLAAAHASGLVHRDIKPDNVLIHRDGRPLVTDFGLATMREADDAAGAVVGTPAYMPPEQLEGRAVDPRSDQFSFCVMAYEALFGTRPFAGASIGELAAAIARGVPMPASPNGVPQGVIRCLVRGLAARPEDRFPSMDALDDALLREADRPKRRRRALLAAGVVIALGATVAVAVTRGLADPEDSVRSAASSRMQRIWGESQRAALRRHFRETGAPRAEETGALVVRGLDDYRTSWLAARVDAWAATRVRGEVPQDMLERRIACLDLKADAMRAAVAVLSTATVAEVAKARDVVTALPEVATCSDLERLRHEPARVSSPMDAELAALSALVSIGRKDEAKARVVATIANIERSGDTSRLPRAVFDLGWIEALRGNHAEAEVQLRRALELGAAAQDHVLVAEVWLRLFSVIGFEQRRPEAALALEPAVRAAVLQAGNTLVQQANLARSLGLVEAARTNHPAARDHFLRARELYVALRGERHYDVALADINIASAVLNLGELDEATRRLERALAGLDPKLHGPTIAQAHQNLCAIAWRREDWAGSERHCRLAAEVYTSALGADHPLTSKSLMFRARALRKLHRLDEATETLLRARAIQEKTMPAGNQERIHTDLYLAQIAEDQHDHARAEELALRAVTALREHGIPPHLQSFALSELARIIAYRDPARALDYYDDAIRGYITNAGRDPSGDTELLTDMTKAALAAHQPGRALAWFDKLPAAAAALPALRESLVAKRR